MGLIRKEDLHSSCEEYIGKMHSNPNLLINGDFQVWQRGTQFNNSSEKPTQYTADRWIMWSNKNSVVSNGDGWHLEWVSGGNDDLIQVVELPKSAINSQMVLSFFINTEAGVSIKYGVNNGTSVNGSDKTQEVTQTYTGKGHWEYVVLIIPSTVPTNSKLRVYFATRQNNVGKAIKLAKIKLELGSTPTQVVPRLYAEELALCKRYYQYGAYRGVGSLYTASGYIYVPLDVNLRITPTLGTKSAVGVIRTANGHADVKTISLAGLCNNGIMLGYTHEISSPVTNTPVFWDNGRLELDAEIY